MGIGNSRQERYERRQRRRSTAPGYNRPTGRKRRGFFRKIRPLPTTKYDVYNPSYPQPYAGCSPGASQIPAYVPPQMPLYQPMPYGRVGPSYMSPPPIMMYSPQPSPPMATPYMAPPPMAMPSPYIPQVQPIYNNNMAAPVSMPMGMRANGPYTSAYQSPPVRLVTDWTGGGQISPGFLGPPI